MKSITVAMYREAARLVAEGESHFSCNAITLAASSSECNFRIRSTFINPYTEVFRDAPFWNKYPSSYNDFNEEYRNERVLALLLMAEYTKSCEEDDNNTQYHF